MWSCCDSLFFGPTFGHSHLLAVFVFAKNKKNHTKMEERQKLEPKVENSVLKLRPGGLHLATVGFMEGEAPC